MGRGPVWRAPPNSSSPDLRVPFELLQVSPSCPGHHPREGVLSTGPNSSLGLAVPPGPLPKVSFSRVQVTSRLCLLPALPFQHLLLLLPNPLQGEVGGAGAQQDPSGAHRLPPSCFYVGTSSPVVWLCDSIRSCPQARMSWPGVGTWFPWGRPRLVVGRGGTQVSPVFSLLFPSDGLPALGGPNRTGGPCPEYACPDGLCIGFHRVRVGRAGGRALFHRMRKEP